MAKRFSEFGPPAAAKISEYEAVLRRDEHRKVHGLTVQQLDDLLNSLVRVAEPVQIKFLWRPVLSDPRDDMALETAVNGRADLLVTFNRKDFAAASKDFAHETMRPSEALAPAEQVMSPVTLHIN